MSTADVQYISDEQGELTAVIVPIALWKEIVSEFETQYLLKSEAMKHRLLEAPGATRASGWRKYWTGLESNEKR